MMPHVSVVVPTCNRPELLDGCLRALTRQDFDPRGYEVVVVDDAASGKTRRQVEEWACRTKVTGPAIRYIPACSGSHGPAAARNLGWRTARGEIIAFTDDDCLPERDWLCAGLKALTPDAAGVTGRIIVPLPEHPTDYEKNVALLEAAPYLTANCFYRRCALEEAGGFDERFELAWREDSDLAYTLLDKRRRLVEAPEARVVHPVRPAAWGVSLGQQRKAMYNALLHKKHPEHFPWSPRNGPIWEYYAIVLALAGLVASLLSGHRRAALVSGGLWAALTGRFCRRRLSGASKSPSHVVEMVVTSALIPPLSVFWRLRGAIRYRVVYF